jgi:hypothetical protein
LRVEVDEEGQVRLSGIFDPDVHLHFVMKDPPVDPSRPLPKIPQGSRIEVVSRTSADPCTIRTYKGLKMRFTASLGEEPDIDVELA